MRNCDKYKTEEELRKAFAEFCLGQKCFKCEYEHKEECLIQFAYDEHVEGNQEKKYRPYTRKEAIPLVGKILHIPKTHYSAEMFGAFEFIVNKNGKVHPLGYGTQEELIKAGATIDGYPFGVEVKE